MNVMTAAPELPFFFAVHESARRVVHEVKGQCTGLSGPDTESVNGLMSKVDVYPSYMGLARFARMAERADGREWLVS